MAVLQVEHFDGRQSSDGGGEVRRSVCSDELDHEAAEQTGDELTTLGAVDFSVTVGGRSRAGTLRSTSLYDVVVGFEQTVVVQMQNGWH